MDADWDLHAIVRRCSTVNNNTPIPPNVATNYDSFPPSRPFHTNENSFESFQGHFDQPLQVNGNSFENFQGHFDQPLQINENSFEKFQGHFDQPLQNNENSFDDFSGLFDGDQNDPFVGLQEIYQVFCVDPAAENQNTTVVGANPVPQVFQPNELVAQVQPMQQMHVNMPRQENVSSGNTNFRSPLSFPPGTSAQPVVRQKRRKNQLTRIIKEMTQEQLAVDSWAWRKYGQKPIKGSPYPRNYYRCSTSKGCAARKQVERSLTDPEMFVVSYTNDHTHPRPIYRSSLTGATRYRFNPGNGLDSASGQNKMNITTTNNNDIYRKAISLPMGSHSSPGSGSSFSPDTPTKEGETTKQNGDVEMAENGAAYNDEDENVMMVNDLMMNDDEDIFMFKDSDESSGGDLIGRGALMTPGWTPADYIAATATMFDREGGDGAV